MGAGHFTFGQLQGIDLTGYQLMPVYWLELDHGLMGFFPAVINSTTEVVRCIDPDLLAEVGEMLTPRRCKVGSAVCLVHEGMEIAYDLSEHSEDQKPVSILTRSRFDALMSGEEPFRWAYGLIGDDMNIDEFRATLDAALRQGPP